jgi:hypothetical protein
MTTTPGSRAGTASVLVPEGTRLLHIGPHKTGTSSLQGAFHLARPKLAAQGVHYAGPHRQPMLAAHAVVGTKRLHEQPSIERWHALLREIRTAEATRVVISSEAFAAANGGAVKRVVADLDPTRIHVAVTLRPLARIMPSQWQQFVQGGSVTPFEDWLTAMLADTDPRRESFWRRHRHDRLVKRWADVAGVDRLTVVVVDDRDHDLVLRRFEQLTGLSDGTLVEDRRFENRSMTLPEIEAVRAFNIALNERGLDPRLQAHVMRVGAAKIMKRVKPDPAWPKVEMPRWALQQVDGLQREMIDAIATSGVRVLGDLETLMLIPPLDAAPEHLAPVSIPPEVSGALGVSVLEAMGMRPGTKPVRGEPVALAGFRTRRLIEAIVRRSPGSAQRRLARIFRRRKR